MVRPILVSSMVLIIAVLQAPVRGNATPPPLIR